MVAGCALLVALAAIAFVVPEHDRNPVVLDVAGVDNPVTLDCGTALRPNQHPAPLSSGADPEQIDLVNATRDLACRNRRELQRFLAAILVVLAALLGAAVVFVVRRARKDASRTRTKPT
jgi:hypothetical protein